MKKAVAVATLLAALGAVAGGQGSARAAEKTKKGAAAIKVAVPFVPNE